MLLAAGSSSWRRRQAVVAELVSIVELNSGAPSLRIAPVPVAGWRC